jgi:hypothetical protein
MAKKIGMAVVSPKELHTSRFYGCFPRVNKFTPAVFQDNLGQPFSPQLKWINSQISDGSMDSTEVPPSWPEIDNVYKYLFYTSLP